MNLTITDLLSLKGKPSPALLRLTPDLPFKNVSTDSRTIEKGDLFIALRGENLDGHSYLKEIEQKGACAAIVDEKWFKKAPKQTKFPVFVARDTLWAMQDLAHNYRKKFKIPILVIAGSNGKTTTKELVAHVLGTSFNVLKTEANYNNHVGVPQMLFRLRSPHEIAVLEIGTNHPGETATLTKIIEPTHVLVTNIGKEHLEFFKNIEGVAKEETKAFFITEELGGFAFVNADDPFLAPFKELFGEWSISYGTKAGAGIAAKRIGFLTKRKLTVELKVGKKKFRAATSIISDYAPNLLAGVIAIAVHFRISPTKIRLALEQYTPHSKRMEAVRTRRGVTIINDAYNANPESFASAISTLRALKTKGKKYIVSGDMFELGTASAREHASYGELLAKNDLTGYFFTGSGMKKAFDALVKKKKKAPAYYYDNKKQIISHLRPLLEYGDIVLVKGSRGMKMEEIVEKLRMTK
jgi:UDP-N-acetylmuramoyl-tripeptide--D-alanyl-D-alanine ligase